MDINLSLASPNKTATLCTGNQTVAECLCTIYTTASECDTKTSNCVYEWFLVLMSVMLTLSVCVYVARATYNILQRVETSSQQLERITHRRGTHQH